MNTSRPSHSEQPIPFAEVIAEERKAINSRRRGVTEGDGYTALCLSGGGIRSATFCLGVIQGLAKANLLKQFDYLSTVSGGGYVGSWLTTWINRSDFSTVNSELASQHNSKKSDEEPEPVQHLRDYSNYLTPKSGLLNADTWTLAATFLRNMLLNWAVILPLLAATMMLPRFMIALLTCRGGISAILLMTGAAALLNCFAVFYEAVDLPSLGNARWPQWRFKTGFLATFAASALMLSIAWAWYVQGRQLHPEWSTWLGQHPFLDIALENLKSTVAGIGLVMHTVSWGTGLLVTRAGIKGENKVRRALFITGAAAITGGVGGYAIAFVAEITASLAANNLPLYSCIASPLFMGAFLTAGLLHVGLVRGATQEEDREWWASSTAWCLMVTSAWLVVFTLVCYAPQLLFSELPAWCSASVSITGILSGILTAFIGHSESTSATTRKSKTPKKKLLDALMPLASILFIAVFLTLLSLCISWILSGLELPFSPDHHLLQLHYSYRDHWLIPLFLLLSAVGLIMSYFVDINRFSLHCMYRNRLTRAYLGASRNKSRAPNLLTGFDPEDNIAVKNLPRRPFQVINIALNLTHDEKLSWQQRKAESFTMTPLHAGNRNLLYRPISEYGSPEAGILPKSDGISLGTAMAISGAAASPNMGYHSSPLVTFMMALFNLRLGWWLGNPAEKNPNTWRSYGPDVSAGVMLREMFGLTSHDYKYVYLSDGGHFENLGLYEMVLRRCRFILVVDAGCDCETKFEDLGNALRKIRIDFCIPITINLDPILTGKKRCATGTIDYAAVDGSGTPPGKLIYLKPSVTGNEPPDIYNYSIGNRLFPHEPTSDQWFSESQFESYRMLGFHTIRDILQDNWSCESNDQFLSTIETYLGGKNA